MNGGALMQAQSRQNRLMYELHLFYQSQPCVERELTDMPVQSLRVLSLLGMLLLALFARNGPIHVAAEANQIYVVSYGNRIVRVNDMAGAGSTTLGSVGGDVNQFVIPHGIYVDASGRIYVADSGNARIVRVDDMTGKGWTTLGSRGRGINQFDQPSGIFVDGSGRIYVTDTANNRVVRVDDITGAGWTTLGTEGHTRWLGIIGDLRTALGKTPISEEVLRELLAA